MSVFVPISSSAYYSTFSNGVSDCAQEIGRVLSAGRRRLRGASGADDYSIARSQLEEVRNECSQEDWDGYGAKPINGHSFILAEFLLQQLPPMVAMPDISVDPDGEVDFEWRVKPGYAFSISIAEDGGLTYAGLFGLNSVRGKEYFVNSIPKAILDNLSRLNSEIFED